MKRIIALVLGIILAVGCLTSCGNKAIGLGNYSYEHIHFSDAKTGYCGTIKKWYNNEIGIEVKTAEYGSCYLSEGSYMMFSDADRCPYCK